MAGFRYWLENRLAELQMGKGDFAEACEKDAQTIRRWIKGLTTPSREDQITIALALQMEREGVFACFDAEKSKQNEASAGYESESSATADDVAMLDEDVTIRKVWVPDVTATFAHQLSQRDLVNRRDALKALAILTGAQLLEPLEGWLGPNSSAESTAKQMAARPLAESDVARLEQAALALKKLKGSGELGYKAVLGLLDDVTVALRRSQAERVERGLCRVMAILAQTAASSAWDAGMQRCAQDYYQLAVRAAHSSGDLLFGANALAGLARQMYYLDRSHDALELVRLAQAGVRDRNTPKLHAMLLTREAWAYAATGRAAAFARATDTAYEMLAKAGPEEPDWINYFDAGELAGVTGGRWLEMARIQPARHAETARDSIIQAITARGQKTGRGYALDHIGLAECAFLLRDTKTALVDTHRAIDIAEQVASGRVRLGLKKLRHYVADISTVAGREATHRLEQVVQGAA